MPTHPIPERISARRRAIGVRIRHARERRGLSQEELAHRADLARTTVVSIETGIRSTSLDSLLLIAEVFGVELDDLIRAPSADERPAAADWVPR